MHERSLVQNLLKQVQQIVADEGGGQVQAIQVQVGDLSGVEPMLFESAFADLVTQYFSATCRLVLEVVPVKATCPGCGHQFEIREFTFHCPCCSSSTVEVTQGDDVKLMSITVDSENPMEGVVS